MPLSVCMAHVRKTFARVLALDDVSLRLSGGRVHGLLGENGAGKTTLMNVLYGLLRSDAGEILIDEKPATIREPREALAAATNNYSLQFGWNELGQITPGRRADILVVDGDPTHSIWNARHISTLIMDGNVMDREGLLNLRK